MGLTALPAAAIPPPPPPPPTAHYGPVAFCTPYARFDVAEDEAVEWNPTAYGMAYSLLTIGYRVDAVPFDDPAIRAQPLYRDYARQQVSLVEMDDGSSAERFALSSPQLPRPPAYVRWAIGPNGRRVEWLFLSAQFDGSRRDLAILARFTLGTPTTLGCGAPTWTDAAFVADADPKAGLLSWHVARGPTLACRNGIGFAMEQGDTGEVAWPGTGPAYVTQIRLGARTVKLRWPQAARPGPAQPGPLPAPGTMARIVTETDTASPPRWRAYMIEPQDVPPAARAAGRFGIEISGPGTAGQDVALLQRFQSVAMDDPRCFKPGTAE